MAVYVSHLRFGWAVMLKQASHKSKSLRQSSCFSLFSFLFQQPLEFRLLVLLTAILYIWRHFLCMTFLLYIHRKPLAVDNAELVTSQGILVEDAFLPVRSSSGKLI